MFVIFKNKDFFFYVSIVIVSFFFAVSQTQFQIALEAPLLLNENIKVNQYNSFTTAIMSQYSLIIQLITFLFKKGFDDVFVISQILLSISNFCFFLGIFLTIKSLIIKIFNSLSSRVFCWIVTFFIVFVMHLHFGQGDYAVLIRPSLHTFGVMGIAISTLIFGLIANGNFKLSVFIVCVFVSIHMVHGAWMLGVLTLSIFFDKYLNNNFYKIKSIYFGLIFGFLFIGLSYFYFINLSGNINYFKNIKYDMILMQDWIKYWEDHRTKEINLTYLFKSIILFFILLLSLKICKKYLNRATSFLLIFVAISIGLSSIIYIFYKTFFNYLPFFLIQPMPTRVLNVHSVISWPIIISLSIIYMKFFSDKFKLNFYQILTASLIILCFINMKGIKDYYNYFFKHYDSKLGINSFLKNNPLRTRFAMFYHHSYLEKKKIIKDYDFWIKIKNIDDGFYWLAPPNEIPNLTFISNKPILINPKAFDMPMYDPSTLIFIKNIIEDLWHISFKNPIGNEERIKSLPTLIKKAYEEKDLDMWKKILNKYDVKYVITPNDWNIDLPIKLMNSEITVYVIE